MITGPTRTEEGDDTATWRGSPYIAFAIKTAAFVLPLMGAWLAIKVSSPAFFRPDGFAGLLLWILQALVVGLVASKVIDIFSRRLLPLATLFNMSLVFPDRAPSRFGVALRAGSVKRLSQRTTGSKASKKMDTSAAQDFAELAVGMVAQLSTHDRLTRGHSERVRAYADLIAEEMKLPDQDRIRLAWGALLHDLGKLEVPAEILNKNGRPTEDEWKILAEHPANAETLLAPLADWLGPWAGAATEHHERWDGDGYPTGLAGQQISLAGRITAVADAYDTMTSTRSYKRAISPQDARRELVACSGKQFDADVVRAFLAVSLGRRWTAGPMAFFAELPGVGSAGGSVVPTVVTSLLVAGSFGTVPREPEVAPVTDLAFVEEETTTSSTAPSPNSTSTSGPSQPGSSTTAPSTPGSPTTPPAGGAFGPTTTSRPTTTTSAGPISTSTTQATTTSTTATSTSTSTTQATTTSTTAASTTTSTSQATTTTTEPLRLIAYDDTIEVRENWTISIYTLTNDDNNGSPFASLRVVTPPQHAALLTLNPNHINYRSISDYVGPDSFEYEVCNLAEECDTAWVYITVTN